MATKQVYFSGEARWAQVYGKGDEKYKAWKIEVALDKDSQKTFDESGCQLRAKKEDGKYWVKFRRDHSKTIGKEVVEFDPPEVIDKNGDPITDSIGNGSTVTVRVALFDTAKGVGHRLEKIRVDNLVVYERPKIDAEPEVLPPLEGQAF